jgi:hypothetical protein
MHKIEQVAVDVAIAISHRLTARLMAIATSPLDIRVNGPPRGADASAVMTSALARAVIAFDADHLVRPVGAAEHRDWAGETRAG